MTARAFIRDSLGLAASQYVARAILLARGLASAAALGPAGFGAWNALNLILDYGAYASLGAIQGLDLNLPARAARGEVERARRAMRGAWSIILAGGAAFTLAVAAVLATGTWVSAGDWGPGAPALMLVAAFVQLGILYHAAVLRAHGDFRAVSVGLALQAVVGGGIGILTVWRAGVWGLLWGWLLGGACAIGWMRRSPARPPLLPSHLREGAALAASGLPMFAFFALALVIRSLDRIALARFGSNQALGYYGLGLTATALALYLPEAAAAVLLPRVAAASQGARDPESTRREVVRVHRSLMVLLPALVGPGVLCAPFLLQRLLPDYAPSFAPIRILALAALVNSMATLPCYYLLGLGQARSLLGAAGAAAVVATAAVFGTAWVAPRPTEIAWATTAGYAAFALPMLARAAPRLVADRNEAVALWFGTLAPSAWAAVVLLGLSSPQDATPIGAAWRSLAFLAVYAPVGWVFGRGSGMSGVLVAPRDRP